MVSLIFRSVNEILGFPVAIKMKVWFYPINTSIGAVVNIAGNYMLIPMFGYMALQWHLFLLTL